MKLPIAAALLVLVSSGQAMAQTSGADAFHATTLNLSAYGEVKAAPDMASITLGVATQAPTAAEAMRLNAARMSEIVGALKREGLADRDIQTSNINLGAQYAYPANQSPKLTGFQATNDVRLTVRDLAKLGPVIDAVSAAGANQVNGVSFGLKDPQTAEDDARRQAVKALSAKAALYAQATGYKVARLVNLSEGGGYTPSPPRPMMAFAKAAAPVSTPVEAGELNVRIDVSGVYELGR